MAETTGVLSDIEMLDIIRNWRDYPNLEVIATIKLLRENGFDQKDLDLLQNKLQQVDNSPDGPEEFDNLLAVLNPSNVKAFQANSKEEQKLTTVLGQQGIPFFKQTDTDQNLNKYYFNDVDYQKINELELSIYAAKEDGKGIMNKEESKKYLWAFIILLILVILFVIYNF